MNPAPRFALSARDEARNRAVVAQEPRFTSALIVKLPAPHWWAGLRAKKFTPCAHGSLDNFLLAEVFALFAFFAGNYVLWLQLLPLSVSLRLNFS
jgi:hypothetical protein